MSKHLLWCSVACILFVSCATTSRKAEQETTSSRARTHFSEPISTSFRDVDTLSITKEAIAEGLSAAPLTDLPRNQDGAFVLSPGLYEADFKTYCLQPGTPGPSSNDAYFKAPLMGNRKEIIETILRKSTTHQHLEQKNIQLLLWSVVSRSNFNSLSFPVQRTARELLTSKQIFELQGGMLGAATTVVKLLPATPGLNEVKNLFDKGVQSYDAIERLAVLTTPSRITNRNFKREQWVKQEDGYYVRYLPGSYSNTRIQVYVPASIGDSTSMANQEYTLFDPASSVVVPAYSNAQRLGIGGPIIDIVRVIIQTTERKPAPPKPPVNKGGKPVPVKTS
ncbi:MAG TPA: hypothetical protein VLC28_08850 [Flavitalea sp.]|nr:hypothetical protein [Flavitalea sp.]